MPFENIDSIVSVPFFVLFLNVRVLNFFHQVNVGYKKGDWKKNKVRN